MSDDQNLVSTLSNMKVLEIAELVKALEKEWGVSAAAPVAVAAAPAAGAPVAAEKTNFQVVLTEAGASKINVIKVVREITSLGLAEAKALVDGAPKVLVESASKDQANDIKTKIEAAGGKVEMK